MGSNDKRTTEELIHGTLLEAECAACFGTIPARQERFFEKRFVVCSPACGDRVRKAVDEMRFRVPVV